MKIERSIAIKNTLVTRLCDLYSTARMCHLTFKQLDERYHNLFAPYPKLPNRVHQYIRGYRHALDDNLYRFHLQYGYEWQGVTYPANWDTLPEELKEALRKNEPITHGHYWKETFRTKSEVKPYSIGSN